MNRVGIVAQLLQALWATLDSFIEIGLGERLPYLVAVARALQAPGMPTPSDVGGPDG